GQTQLEGREAAPALFHEFRVHADSRAGLDARVGKAVHDRLDPEMPRRIEVAGPDPAARGRNEAFGALRLRPLLRHGPFPGRNPVDESIAFCRRERCLRYIPALVDPGHCLAVSRVDKAMAEPQAVIDAEHGAFDLKAAAGAEFARKPHVELPRKTACPQPLAESERLG